MSQKVIITSPVGRIVRGSLYEPQKVDMDGRPLVIKTGLNAGQPRVDYQFAIAIPKGTERHWAETPWGAQIWNVGHAAYPQQAGLPGFAWKVIDGDDQTPSMKSKPPGKRPCDNEGYKGNWVIRFSAGFAPKIYKEESPGAFMQIAQPDFVKPGYYVEVNFSVEGNSGQSPGVYMNHSMVCFRAYGPEISFGPDVASAGFGQSALPPGASAMPLASSVPLPQVAALPNAPVAAPAPSSAPVAAVMPAPVTASVAPAVLVVPNTGFLQMPAAPPAPAKQMTAAAGATPYAAYMAAGWTDAQLIQNGLMVA